MRRVLSATAASAHFTDADAPTPLANLYHEPVAVLAMVRTADARSDGALAPRPPRAAYYSPYRRTMRAIVVPRATRQGCSRRLNSTKRACRGAEEERRNGLFSRAELNCCGRAALISLL